MSTWGKHLQVTLFGTSHGPGVGAVVTGLPSGFELRMEDIEAQVEARRTRESVWSSRRIEKDSLQWLSGLSNGRLNGDALCVYVPNESVRSGDYRLVQEQPRPSQSDLMAQVRYEGYSDLRGGGAFSARRTVALTAIGAVAKQILESVGVQIGAQMTRIGELSFRRFDGSEEAKQQILAQKYKSFRLSEPAREDEALSHIRRMAEAGDSLGGQIEVLGFGLPRGIGGPYWEGLEARLAELFFGLPGLKGFELGDGVEAASTCGSERNDSPIYRETATERRLAYGTNRDGGLQGGLSNGEPLIVQLSFKPTPSIARTQPSVCLRTGENIELKIEGRHDPCYLPRALAVSESLMALGLLDSCLSQATYSDLSRWFEAQRQKGHRFDHIKEGG